MKDNDEDLNIKIDFYIISLWLLFLLVIILTIDLKSILEVNQCRSSFFYCVKENAISLVSLLMFFYSIHLCRKLKHKFKGTKQLPTKVLKVEDVDCEHLTFLTTYIIPLVCIPISEERYFIVFLILLIVIGAISVKTNLFYANPTLALLGYHVYKVDTDDGLNQKIVLSKNILSNGLSIQYIKIDQKTYYARGYVK